MLEMMERWLIEYGLPPTGVRGRCSNCGLENVAGIHESNAWPCASGQGGSEGWVIPCRFCGELVFFPRQSAGIPSQVTIAA